VESTTQVPFGGGEHHGTVGKQNTQGGVQVIRPRDVHEKTHRVHAGPFAVFAQTQPAQIETNPGIHAQQMHHPTKNQIHGICLCLRGRMCKRNEREKERKKT
jgi:hypothetical protein